MAQPYIGEIRMFAGNFPPYGWMFCEGQLLLISEWDVLFNLIGTTYGGDGEETFALPDMRGRLPVHQGNGVQLAEMAGVEEVTLTFAQMPNHTHVAAFDGLPANSASPQGRAIAPGALVDMYVPSSGDVQMAADTVRVTGGSQPHSNMQPYLCVSFIISMFGLYPSPT